MLSLSRRITSLAVFAAALGGNLHAQAASAQRFDLSVGEHAGFGFVVGQPGPIVVTVAHQGAPLIMSLTKPGGSPIDLPSGTGPIQIAASADDIKKGDFWVVSVRLADGVTRPVASGGRGGPRMVALATAVSGTVTIQHPPGDTARAKTSLSARSALRRVAPLTGGTDVGALRLAEMMKADAAQQAQQLAANRARLTADLYQKVSAVIAIRAQGRAAAMDPVALAAPPPARGAASGVSQSSSASTGTGSPGTPASGGASPAGSTQPSSVVANPKITGLDLSEGKPETQVMISGTGFSATPGTVYLMVTQGKLMRAKVLDWRDTQIYFSVPDTSGVGPMAGQLYVQRGAQQSNMVPFRFLPTLVSYTFGWTNDDMDLADFQSPNASNMADHLPNWPFIGLKGDDHFYKTLQLKNGWVVDTAYVEHLYFKDLMNSPNRADAYVTEYRPGTASPYVKVHWWAEPLNEIGYVPRVVVVGPKGTSWR